MNLTDAFEPVARHGAVCFRKRAAAPATRLTSGATGIH